MQPPKTRANVGRTSAQAGAHGLERQSGKVSARAVARNKALTRAVARTIALARDKREREPLH